ncbi:MAG: hypothetical protein JWO98_85 [Frankiales bacterium]|nr:hypothetical protein [Frankiales bacterium]
MHRDDAPLSGRRKDTSPDGLGLRATLPRLAAAGARTRQSAEDLRFAHSGPSERPDNEAPWLSELRAEGGMHTCLVADLILEEPNNPLRQLVAVGPQVPCDAQ